MIRAIVNYALDNRFIVLAIAILLLIWGAISFHELPVEAYFRDYHDVGGLQFAFEIDSGASADEISQKILIDKIELDPEISDSPNPLLLSFWRLPHLRRGHQTRRMVLQAGVPRDCLPINSLRIFARNAGDKGSRSNTSRRQ